MTPFNFKDNLARETWVNLDLVESVALNNISAVKSEFDVDLIMASGRQHRICNQKDVDRLIKSLQEISIDGILAEIMTALNDRVVDVERQRRRDGKG